MGKVSLNPPPSPQGGTIGGSPKAKLAGLWRTWGLGVAAIAFVWLGMLLSGRVITTRDIGATHLPWRGEWVRQVKNGWLPLWNPKANGGRPFWADPNSQAAYPLTAIFLLLPPWVAMTVFLAIHHLGLMAGLGFLARRAGAPPEAAAAAGTVLATTGVAFSLTTFPNSLASLAWVPWSWGLVLPAGEGDKVPNWAALGAGGLLGMSFLSGEPITAGLGLAGALLLACRYRFSGALWLLFGFFSLAFPVLVPLLHFFPESVRGTLKVSSQALEADCLAPRRWLELFFPRFLGTPLGDASSGFWAAPSFPWQRYYPSIFFGAGTVFLAVLGGLRGGKKARVWVVLALAGLVAATLPAWPWGLALLRKLPGGGLWRFAIKGLQLVLLAFSPLLALGLSHPSGKRWLPLTLALVLCLPALFPSLTRRAAAELYPASAATLAQVDSSVWRNWWIADGLTNALPLLVLGFTPRLAAVVLTFAVVHWPLFFATHWLLPHRAWEEPPPLIRHQLIPPGASLLSVTGTPGSSVNASLAFRNLLVPDYGLAHGNSYVLARGPDGLEPMAGELLAAAAEKLPGEDLIRLGANLGAQAVLIPVKDAPAGCHFWENMAVCLPEAVSPPVYLARRAFPAPDLLSALAWLTSPAFRPGSDVTLETLQIPTGFAAGELEELPGSPTHRRFRVHSEGPTLLVVQQNFTKGWRANIDGERVPVQRVNFARMGVAVPGGTHLVALVLEPTPYLVGGTGPVLFFLSLWALRTRGRRAASGAPARRSQAKEPVR
ncbi:MAG: hypothetical protein ACUVRY_08390 [Thermoanaerobaculaceae bacterium]